MQSKFNGRCKVCGGPYKAGDEINWSKEEGARHPECGEPVQPSLPGCSDAERWAIEHGYKTERELDEDWALRKLSS